MIRVSRRGGFSDRLGIKPENTEIQLYELDERTRIKIYNLINDICSTCIQNNKFCDAQPFLRYINREIFCERTDIENIIYEEIFYDKIHQTIMENSYDDVLTIVEAIAQYWDEDLDKKYGESRVEYTGYGIRSCSICDTFNMLFKAEYVGYRFINREISPITDEYEISSISEAVNNVYHTVAKHISKAHSLLADRTHPDYENSIKESISSVEAMCEIITGVKGKEATLGKMLKKLDEKGIEIHSGLKAAFNILYGYTSDANGIRHAGEIGGKESTFEEAKFMLVSCSAFINYLKGIMSD